MGDATKWLEQQREQLGDAIQPVYEPLRRALCAEFEQRDRERRALTDEIAKLIIRASTADELQKQNESLRAQLEAARETRRQPGGSLDEERDGNGTIPYAEYERLAKKYNTQCENEKVYKQSVEFLTQKCHRLKESFKQWEEYKAYRAQKDRTSTLRKDEHQAGTEGPSTPTSLFVQRHGLDHGAPSTPSIMPTSSLSMAPTAGDISAPPGLESSHASSRRNSVAARASEGNQTVPRYQVEVECSTVELTKDGNLPLDGPGPANAAQPTSSQATEDETPNAHEDNCDCQENDDQPVFLSSRPVVRNRRSVTSNTSSRQVSTKTDRQTPPAKIKLEPMTNSSPIRFLSQKRLARTDTMDLDDIGNNLCTPHKRRRLERIRTSQRTRRRAISEEPALDRSDDEPKVKKEPGATVADEHAAFLLPTLMRSNSDSVLHREQSGSSHHSNLSSRIKNATVQGSRALQQISPNARTVGPGGGPGPRTRGITKYYRHAEALRHLAEDGDSQLQARRRRSRGSGSSSKSPARGVEGMNRLQTLLDTETPQKHALAALPTPSTSKPVRSDEGSGPASRLSNVSCGRYVAHSRPEQRDAPSASASKSTRGHERDTMQPPLQEPVKDAASARPRSRQAATPSLPAPSTASRNFEQRRSEQEEQRRQQEVPLRERDVDNLKVGDFKLNPNYIGHHLATDVVRDRETRRCLPGCTRECCSGAFRAMVEAGAMQTLPRGIYDSSQPEADGGPVSAEEHRILQQHLGNGYSRDRVNSMPKAQLDELVLQARTRLLSDRHGRHKRVWERPRSPPGFWRTEMPTTQEMEEDREKARAMEKERVREMWEDAVRGGGRWVFRDES